MDSNTIARLNAINRAFYAATAAEFDRSRSQPWPGWLRLLAHLPLPCPSVLDVGCGNGRFGAFLATSSSDRLAGHGEIITSTPGVPPSKHGEGELVPVLHYHGVDSNPALLAVAQTTLATIPNLTVTLEQRDIVESPLDSGQYDLVVAFGLLHHIPGVVERRDFVRGLAERVRPGGVLTFACWRFYEYERFRSRVVPWPDDLVGKIEPGDYLLDWRRGKVAEDETFPQRYCHYVDDAEHDGLAAGLESVGMREVVRYRADGETDALNCYSVFSRPA